MRCTALCSSSVICSAGVCRRKVIAAHCEHWRAAVSAEKITRIHVVILFHAPIICCRTLFKLLLNGGKGSVVNDGSVVVFKNYMVGFMNLFLSAVNFFCVCIFPDGEYRYKKSFCRISLTVMILQVDLTSFLYSSPCASLRIFFAHFSAFGIFLSVR